MLKALLQRGLLQAGKQQAEPRNNDRLDLASKTVKKIFNRQWTFTANALAERQKEAKVVQGAGEIGTRSDAQLSQRNEAREVEAKESGEGTPIMELFE